MLFCVPQLGSYTTACSGWSAIFLQYVLQATVPTPTTYTMYKAKVAMFISTVCHTVRRVDYLPRVCIVLWSAAAVRYLFPVLYSVSLSDVHVFFSPVEMCTFNRYHVSVLNTGGTGIVLCSTNGQLLHSCLSYAGTVAMSCIFCKVVHLIIMNFVVRVYPCVFLFTGGCNTLLACSLSSSYSAETAKKLPSNVLSSTYFLGITFFFSKIFFGEPPQFFWRCV
jgi:hypothetical protein